MIKNPFVKLAHDLNEFAFDLDPWNGAEETEALEMVMEDLLEYKGESSADFLKGILGMPDDYRFEDLTRAEDLLRRLETICIG